MSRLRLSVLILLVQPLQAFLLCSNSSILEAARLFTDMLDLAFYSSNSSIAIPTLECRLLFLQLCFHFCPKYSLHYRLANVNLFQDKSSHTAPNAIS